MKGSKFRIIALDAVTSDGKFRKFKGCKGLFTEVHDRITNENILIPYSELTKYRDKETSDFLFIRCRRYKIKTSNGYKTIWQKPKRLTDQKLNKLKRKYPELFI